MQITPNTQQQTLRFRRWNRKGYAVFRSLGNHVTIGSLSGSMVDSSMQKSKVSTIFEIHQTSDYLAQEDNLLNEAELSELKMIKGASTANVLDRTVGCGYLYSNIFIHTIAVVAAYPVSTAFLFYLSCKNQLY